MARADGSASLVWKQRVGRQRRSGLSIAEFCRRESISPASFYAWRKRLGGSRPKRLGGRSRKGPSAGARRPLFVPVELASADGPISGVRIELPGGAVVTLPAQASAELVTAAIRAAAAAVASQERRPC